MCRSTYSEGYPEAIRKVVNGSHSIYKFSKDLEREVARLGTREPGCLGPLNRAEISALARACPLGPGAETQEIMHLPPRKEVILTSRY